MAMNELDALVEDAKTVAGHIEYRFQDESDESLLVALRREDVREVLVKTGAVFWSDEVERFIRLCKASGREPILKRTPNAFSLAGWKT